jgi:thiosulfate reductase cytochrome b subunit
MTTASVTSHERHPSKLHPLPLRIMHWTNAVAMIIMIGSGWKIYNDEVLFGWLHFPDWIVLGREAQGALQWHFLAMWILMLNGLAYVIYGLATGRFERMLFPIRPRDVIATARDALRFKLPHDDLTVYNALQKTLYVGVILVGIIQVISGLVVWKPIQFSELTTLFYDFQGARLVHFLGMAAIVLFLLVHVTLAFIVPQTLVNIVTGGPKLKETAPPLPASDTPIPGEAAH